MAHTPEKAYELLFEGLRYINEPKLRAICEGALVEMKDGYGARSHHHNYVGGLIVHVNEVFTTCLGVCLGVSHLNRDVLLTSAVLHDWMRSEERRVGKECRL